MPTASFRRKTALLVLITVLAVPWVSAAEARFESREAVQAGESTPWELLGRLWSFLRNAWAKSSCNIDPNGLCTAQPIGQTKDGCNVDPNGVCTAQPPVQSKSACSIDPNGLCRP
jgi:hypothetical protein